MVNGSETRQTLEESFKDVFLEANKIIDDGFIQIDGKKVGVDIYLAGDYKVRYGNLIISYYLILQFNKS